MQHIQRFDLTAEQSLKNCDTVQQTQRFDLTAEHTLCTGCQA